MHRRVGRGRGGVAAGVRGDDAACTDAEICDPSPPTAGDTTETTEAGETTGTADDAAEAVDAATPSSATDQTFWQCEFCVKTSSVVVRSGRSVLVPPTMPGMNA